MSWQAQAWVWTLQLPPSVKLLALSLANYADPTGKRIMPGHERVIDETGLSPASLKRGIATLVEAGHLHVAVQSTGRGYRNEYEMPVDMQAVSNFHDGKGGQREPLPRDMPVYANGKGAHHEPNTPDNDVERDHHEPLTVPKRAQAEPLPDAKRGSNNAKKGLKSSKEGAHHEPPIPRGITLEKNPRVSGARVALDPRGCRLPDDWVPSEAGFRFARDLGLDPNETFAAFGDYWRSQPGAKGRKSSWPLTWQTWCRNEVKFSRRRASVPARKSPREQWVDVKNSVEAGYHPRFDA